MVLAAHGPLLTQPPSSPPPKSPIRSYSAQIRSQNEEKTHPPKNHTCPLWFLSPGPDWWMDRMCLDVAQPAGSVSLRWMIYSVAMEGASYGLSLTQNPHGTTIPRLSSISIAVQVGRDFFFDEKIPRHASGQGYVRVVQHSGMWKEMAASKIFTYRRLTTCTEVDKSWTIMSSVYNHLRQGRETSNSGLGTLIRAEVEHQERIEAMGYRSPTWRLLRALKSLLSAVQLQGDSAVTAPSFFPSAGRGTTRFWGTEQGPTVFLWEGLGAEGREECERVIRAHRDWVVWSGARPMKGDCTPRGFEHVGKAIFCGKVKRRKKEHEEPEAEDETEQDAPDNEVEESGRACRQKGWWKPGDVEAKLNTVNMTAWVHKECDITEVEALTKLQEAWDSSEQKDECVVCLDDLERAYWMGTEVGLLGGYGFQGVTLGVNGSCKDGKMGSGCRKFREEGAGRCRQRGGRQELEQARVRRGCTSVAVSSS
jgi:hypothetical protein